MIIPLPHIGISEFCLRAVTRMGTGNWLLLVTSLTSILPVSQRIERELTVYDVGVMTPIHHPVTVDELIKKFRSIQSGGMIVSGLEHFHAEDWQRIDHLRSRLIRNEVVILVVIDTTAENIVNLAPNLASWIAGSSWNLEVYAEELSDEEKEMRLEALRSWSGLTDSEVIEKAQSKCLPSSPEFAEWLALLDHGELI